MYSKNVEIGVGIFVILGFLALLMLAMKVSNLATISTDNGYNITARFSNIGGLTVKSAVKMAGVKIGRVQSIEFNDETYEAVVTLNIDNQYNKLPLDTSASIFTAGLLGAQYIGLEAGGEQEYLQEGDELFITQSAVILEQLIGQFLYKSAAGD